VIVTDTFQDIPWVTPLGEIQNSSELIIKDMSDSQYEPDLYNFRCRPFKGEGEIK
jgi:hypothetical protein